MMASVISDGIIVTDSMIEDVSPVIDDTDLAAETITTIIESNNSNKNNKQKQNNIKVSQKNVRISVFVPSPLEKLPVSAVTIEQAPKNFDESAKVTKDTFQFDIEKTIFIRSYI